MKKLSKLKLHDAAVLSDGEMKNVIGGQTYGTGVFTCWCDSTGASGGFEDATGNCSGTLVTESEMASYCQQGYARCEPYYRG